jgi:triphosphoribosyl-dephospho-CoA synthase
MTDFPACAVSRPSPPCDDDELAEAIAATACRALLEELAAWPKPGLVSERDCGSHGDMDAAAMRASTEALRPFFAELALAGRNGAAMAELRRIGVRAEAAMLQATGGINTHRGAIFGLGMLCAAAGPSAETLDGGTIRCCVKLGGVAAREWSSDIMRGPIPLFSHGSAVLRRHGVAGARAEAAAGFPSIYEIGLPALRLGRALAPHEPGAAAVQACFALIAGVQDTNLLHRGGAEGAAFAAAAAAAFIAAGGVGGPGWTDRAEAVHAQFVARRLSPGGCADLLAMTLFVDALEGESSPS